MSDEVIAQAFLAGRGRWNGCDWPTRFGLLGLDLCALTAKQARLMAAATAGAEAADWRAAARWLAEVEADAQRAQAAAGLAARLAAEGRLAEAAEHARAACELEGRYRSAVVWRPLHEALAGLPTS
jgi:hypothetical protein